MNPYKEQLILQEDYDEIESLVEVDKFCECLTISWLQQMSFEDLITNPDLGTDSLFVNIRDSCILINAK